MKQEFTGVRATREKILPGPSTEERKRNALQEKISDLEKCLKGDSTSKRWQDIHVELTNDKQALLYLKRRLAGRTPLMDSWADPLPG